MLCIGEAAVYDNDSAFVLIFSAAESYFIQWSFVSLFTACILLKLTVKHIYIWQFFHIAALIFQLIKILNKNTNIQISTITTHSWESLSPTDLLVTKEEWLHYVALYILY